MMQPCVTPGALRGQPRLPVCCPAAVFMHREPPEGYKAHVWPGVWATVYRAAVTRTPLEGALSPHCRQHVWPPRLREASARGGPCSDSHGAARGSPSCLPTCTYESLNIEFLHERRVIHLVDLRLSDSLSRQVKQIHTAREGKA